MWLASMFVFYPPFVILVLDWGRRCEQMFGSVVQGWLLLVLALLEFLVACLLCWCRMWVGDGS